MTRIVGYEMVSSGQGIMVVIVGNVGNIDIVAAIVQIAPVAESFAIAAMPKATIAITETIDIIVIERSAYAISECARIIDTTGPDGEVEAPVAAPNPQ